MAKALVFTLVLLLAAPVFAQDGTGYTNDALPACTEAQLTETQLVATEALLVSQQALQGATGIAEFQDMQQQFWQLYAPQFPQCAFAQRLLLAIGRAVDEVLISAAFTNGRNANLAESHLRDASTLIHSLGSLTPVGGEAAEVSEDVATSEADNVYSGSGDDVIGPLELEQGVYIVEIEYTIPRYDFIQVEINRIGERDNENHVGNPKDAGTYSDRFTADLDGGDYTIDIGASGAWTLTIEKVS